MSGICIAVTGRSGSGKTTLIKEVVLSGRFDIEYMTSYVTRTPRANDFGYVYLTKEEYKERMGSSSLWDHFEMFGEYYGTDVAQLVEKIKSGRNILISFYPSKEELAKIHSMYPVAIATIFIDISEERSLEMVNWERQDHEKERVMKESEVITQELLNSIDQVFVPEGNLTKDREQFLALLEEIIRKR